MALKPIAMPLASCLALLAISQDVRAIPTSERIAAISATTNQQICGRDIEPGCRGFVLHAYPRDMSLFRYGEYDRRRDSAAVPKPKAKPTRVNTKGGEKVDIGGNTVIVATAKKYMGLSERSDRKTLARFLSGELKQKIDPVITPWCAAFVNAILTEVGLPTTGSNLGSSFTSYGRRVKDPKPGDIVVIRGGRHSRTHVGIYVGTEMRGKRRYVRLLGGNQSNRVQISSYDASKIIAIRRPG